MYCANCLISNQTILTHRHNKIGYLIYKLTSIKCQAFKNCFFLLTFKKEKVICSLLFDLTRILHERKLYSFTFHKKSQLFFHSISFTTYNFFKTVRFLKMSSVIELNEQLERSLGKNQTVSENGNEHKFEF